MIGELLRNRLIREAGEFVDNLVLAAISLLHQPDQRRRETEQMRIRLGDATIASKQSLAEKMEEIDRTNRLFGR